LLENIKGSGKKFDIINVSDGYAMNYLLPKKLAVIATDKEIKKLNTEKAVAEHKRLEMLEKDKLIANLLESKKIIIRAKAGVNNKLFGAITSKEIAHVIKKEFDIDLDKKKIMLDESLKSLGEKIIKIKLQSDIIAKLNLEIIKA